MPTTATWVHQIEAGKLDDIFSRLYGNEQTTLQKQRARYTQTIREFEAVYGQGKDVVLYSAPGRTEIGGNHTDHNNGIVMAAAVNLDIIAVVAKTNDNFACVKSKGFGNPDIVDITCLEPVLQEFGRSSSLVRGVAAGIQQRGGVLGGFEVYTTSDVLRGSGLSSSAAFEVCMAEIFNGEYNQGRFTPVEIGQIGQFAENKFFGKPSGLMDQTACAVGGAITIDFVDPALPVVQELSFKLEDFGYRMVITDTKGSHAHLTEEYAAIRQEMESVASFFGKETLRQVPHDEFITNIPEIRAKTGDRAVLRAIHFFEDCQRALLLADAVRQNNFNEFLRLIIEGGHSSFEYNQNAYSVHTPAQQGVSLGLALSQDVLSGRGGAWRLQGGGFAGTIQAFVPVALLETYCKALTNVFGGDACYVLSVRNNGAIKIEIPS